MGSLSKKLRNWGHGETEGITHWCPGCQAPHAICTRRSPSSDRPVWIWDGNVEAPTCAPSVRCFTTVDDEGEPLQPPGTQRTLCHYFLQGGMNFCGDCAHELNGQQGVDLPDFPNLGD